jgi:hypothetical protein
VNFPLPRTPPEAVLAPVATLSPGADAFAGTAGAAEVVVGTLVGLAPAWATIGVDVDKAERGLPPVAPPDGLGVTGFEDAAGLTVVLDPSAFNGAAGVGLVVAGGAAVADVGDAVACNNVQSHFLIVRVRSISNIYTYRWVKQKRRRAG